MANALCPSFARRVTVLSTGDVTAAPTFKLVTNGIIYGAVELLGEATALAVRCGE